MFLNVCPQTLFYCLQQGKRKRLAAGNYCEEVEEEDESLFADKIALNNETLIVVCKIFTVNLSEHCLQPQTLFYCLQGKRKRLAAGSYCEEVEEEDVTSSVSRRKIAKK